MKKLRTVPCLDIRYVNLYNADDVPVVDKAEPVATTLLRADADALVEAVDFWLANHPPAGAKPSKVGVKAQLCDVGDWCYCGRWLRLLFQNAANHCSYFLSLQRKAPVVFTWDTIVYPIAADEPEQCPKCGHTQWNHDKTSPDRPPYWYCNYCGRNKDEPIKSFEPDCTVGDFKRGDGFRLGGRIWYVSEDVSEGVAKGIIPTGYLIIVHYQKGWTRIIPKCQPCRGVKEE